MRFIDADALKICLQGHYGVIEQDCSISEKFADGAISGIDAAMFEVDAAPTVDAIPVEWLREKIKEHTDGEGWQDYLANAFGLCTEEWQKEHGEKENEENTDD